MPQDIRIASPCSADWNGMPGNDRVRICPECQLKVYNFSAMTRAEVEALVSAREGRLCARFFQRADGTMLTQNCPTGVREALRRASRVVASVLSAFLVVNPAIAATRAQQKEDAPLVQIKQVQARLMLEVVDASGAFVPNARISLSNESTNAVTEGETDSQGQLRLSGLTRGKYKILITSTGFQTFRADRIALPSTTPPRYQLNIAAIMGEIVMVNNRNPVHALSSFLRRIF
jgi:hypothetical protein